MFENVNKEPLKILAEVIDSSTLETKKKMEDNYNLFLSHEWYAKLIKENKIIQNSDFFLLDGGWTMKEIILFYSNLPTANNLVKLLAVLFGADFKFKISRISHKLIKIESDGVQNLSRNENANILTENIENIISQNQENILAIKNIQGLTIANLINLFFEVAPFNTKYDIYINEVYYTNYPKSVTPSLPESQ